MAVPQPPWWKRAAPPRSPGPRGALLGRTQRAISKAAFATLFTPQLYTLTAVISLPIYQPTLAFDPPPASAFPPAIGLSAMMAVTFGVTTEAIRRGPIGRVSPIEGDIITVVVDVSPGWARISVQDRGPGVSQSDVGAPASDLGTGWGLRLV